MTVLIVETTVLVVLLLPTIIVLLTVKQIAPKLGNRRTPVMFMLICGAGLLITALGSALQRYFKLDDVFVQGVIALAFLALVAIYYSKLYPPK
jgi:hypothetical protein